MSGPLTLRLATTTVLVEALIVIGYVVFLGVADGGEPGAWRVIGYFALYAVAFAGLSWALLRRRRWVRAPLIVLQLMLAATGLGVLRSDLPVAGACLLVLAVTCTAMLLAPATREALAPPRERV